MLEPGEGHRSVGSGGEAAGNAAGLPQRRLAADALGHDQLEDGLVAAGELVIDGIARLRRGGIGVDGDAADVQGDDLQAVAQPDLVPAGEGRLDSVGDRLVARHPVGVRDVDIHTPRLETVVLGDVQPDAHRDAVDVVAGSVEGEELDEPGARLIGRVAGADRVIQRRDRRLRVGRVGVVLAGVVPVVPGVGHGPRGMGDLAGHGDDVVLPGLDGHLKAAPLGKLQGEVHRPVVRALLPARPDEVSPTIGVVVVGNIGLRSVDRRSGCVVVGLAAASPEQQESDREGVVSHVKTPYCRSAPRTPLLTRVPEDRQRRARSAHRGCPRRGW